LKPQDFLHKYALVTGGSGGIGKAIAMLLAQRGSDIGLIARTEEKLNSVTEEITRETGRSCISLVGDVSNFTEMETQFSKFLNYYGRIDVLINCAGINNPKGIFETSVEEWQEVIGINLTGIFICCKLGAQVMAQQMGGTIINISSVQSRVGGRSPQYSASKAGVEGLTRSLAREMAKFNVRVNAVAPGGTETDFAKRYWTPDTRERLRQQTLVGRIAQPEEIANAVVFVASDDASYITGDTLHVNGGYYLG
jgi:3-oxoacyl-[acyl-carrier protein] reductase